MVCHMLTLSRSHSLSHRRTHLCNRAPRIPLVHRAHVVRFSLHGAATTISTLQHHRIVVQLSFRRARLLIACAPTLSTTIPTTRLHLVAGRPYRLLQYALSRLSQSAISLLPKHNLETTIATASFVRRLFDCLFLDTVYHPPLNQTVPLSLRTKQVRPLRLCYSAFLAGLHTDRTSRPSFLYPTTLALPILLDTPVGIPSPSTTICRSDIFSLIHWNSLAKRFLTNSLPSKRITSPIQHMLLQQV
jgi:hypothetical protein